MKESGQTAFEAYNEAGATPGQTYDGKPVPSWDMLPQDQREKWAASEKASGRLRLEQFGPAKNIKVVGCAFVSAWHHHCQACFEANGDLGMAHLLELFAEELRNTSAQS